MKYLIHIHELWKLFGAAVMGGYDMTDLAWQEVQVNFMLCKDSLYVYHMVSKYYEDLQHLIFDLPMHTINKSADFSQ